MRLLEIKPVCRIGILRRFKRHIPAVVLASAVVLTCCDPALAQADASNLKNDVAIIKAEQQRILSSLDEIKQLLAANAATRPGPQPPAPPSALATRDEAFRGNSSATV